MKETVRFLRQRQTRAEEIFWEAVRDNKINGEKIRRQYAIRYATPEGEHMAIADFYCHRYKLVIEIDGTVHDKQSEKDAERDKWLSTNGYNVLRFTNDEIENDLNKILSKLALTLNSFPRPNPAPPLSSGEGGQGGVRCPYFGRCGGCCYQDIPYPEGQLALKRAELKRILGMDIEIVPSPVPYGYRNRMDFVCAFSKIGLRERGSHKNVVDIEECHLLPQRFLPAFKALRQAIIASGIPTYDYLIHRGYLRYLVFRVPANTDDLMISFVTATEDNAVLPLLKAATPFASSVQWLVNSGLADVSFGKQHQHLKNPHITEKIGPFSYKMGPNTFFQNNGLLCESLFSFVRDHVSGPTLDMFCGVGAISVFISGAAESIVGVELEEASIALAQENATLNNVTNVTFEASDARQWLLRNKERMDFKTIVVDPPRTGMGGKVARKVMRLQAETVVYVSCNPSSMRDDLKWFEGNYRLETIRAFDMFPQTPHVEVIGVLRKS